MYESVNFDMCITDLFLNVKEVTTAGGITTVS